jgi:hypothetical protein
MRLYLSLLVIAAVVGLTLGAPSPGSANDQPLILAQRGAREIQRVEPPPAAAPPSPSARPDTIQRPVEVKGAMPEPIPAPAETKGAMPEPIPRPTEIRQTSPPEDMRQVAPPAGVGSKPAGEARKAGAEPGLQLGSLGLSSTNPRVGERVFVTTTLRNAGSRSFSGVRVRFFLDQTQVAEKVLSVAAGGSATASASFKASKSGAQNLRVQVDPGAAIAPLTLARGLTVTGAAKTDMEDFTTPAKKPVAVAKLPPQRLQLDKPKAYAPPPEVPQRQAPADQGKRDHKGDRPLGDKERPSPIPDDLKGQTRVGRGPGGKVIGWGDGIYGVEDQGTGVTTPKGISELDKLLDYGKWPRGGGDGYSTPRDQYGAPLFRPGIGGVADDEEDMFFNEPGAGKDKGSGEKITGTVESTVTNPDGSTTTTSQGENAPTVGNIKAVIIGADKKGDILSILVDYGGGTWYEWRRGKGGAGDAPEGADAKPSPKTPDPQLVLVLMKAAPGTHTDPRIGQVGDPPALAGKPSREGTGAAIAAIAAGAGTAEAKWQFAGVKPGAFLKGPRDPDLPGSGGAGGGLRPSLPIITLPDPPEAKAITAALARTGTPGGQTVTVSAAAGAVQVLATREGKQGWTPLTAGSKLAANSVIRVDKGTGGEVGVGDPKTARSMSWTKIQSGSNHVLYQLQIKK